MFGIIRPLSDFRWRTKEYQKRREVEKPEKDRLKSLIKRSLKKKTMTHVFLDNVTEIQTSHFRNLWHKLGHNPLRLTVLVTRYQLDLELCLWSGAGVWTTTDDTTVFKLNLRFLRYKKSRQFSSPTTSGRDEGDERIPLWLLNSEFSHSSVFHETFRMVDLFTPSFSSNLKTMTVITKPQSSRKELCLVNYRWHNLWVTLPFPRSVPRGK